MSGIAGIIHFDGAPIEPGQIEKMTATMAHRGPDGIHHWARGNVALGQCMLRTTPESLEEIQPLTNEDESLVLVMDGRVDNWEELRRELLGRGAVLRTRADAELVLRAYEVWGRDCLAHIDGDFALVIWDARKRQAFCARDRIGNKPFLYNLDGKTFSFASDVPALLALPWVNAEINQDMIAEFLAGEWHSLDETFWKKVMRLMAATALVAEAPGLSSSRYWAPDLNVPAFTGNDDDLIANYRELLTETVRRKSRSHLPVSFEVSGGLDSSAVFCVAEHLRRSAKLPTPGIKAYTLYFADEGAANEVAFARAVGKHLDLTVHEVVPSLPPPDWYLEEARTGKEFPGFPNALMFLEMRRQIAQDGSRVVLTGEGGDEWFQGSRTYYAEELAHQRWKSFLGCLKHDLQELGTRQTLGSVARYGVFPLLPTPLQAFVRRAASATRPRQTHSTFWLTPAIKKTLAKRREIYRQKILQLHAPPWQAERIEALYDALTEHVISRHESLGARYGIETRYPFRDHRIVEFAFSIPERMCLKGSTKKLIHVQAMRGLLPAAILARKDKADFSAVFHNNLDLMRKPLTIELPRRRPEWFTQGGMDGLYQFYAANPAHGWPHWTLWSIFGCDAVLRGNNDL